MADEAAQVLPGTLDMLVLKVISVAPEHGWGVGQRLQQMSSGVFDVNQGSVYPALQRLLKKGWIRSAWRATDSGRRARYYSITRSGARQLERERESWGRQARAVESVLTWTAG
ncbi:MAG: PadR family transcriptional regulator [Longimicrobiales bacterium]